jgi:hypothetical protein
MADYQLTPYDTVLRTADGVFIPGDPMNVDRQVYEAWLAAGNSPDPYVEPPPSVPASISDRQFFQQLAVSGVISQAEALGAVRVGAIPDPLQQLIDQMPADQQFAATMIVSGATTFERSHPLTVAIGAAYGWTSDQIDAFFRMASAL